MNGTLEDTPTWPPFCGEMYPIEKTAGDPVICTRTPHDPDLDKHFNHELGFSWW